MLTPTNSFNSSSSEFFFLDQINPISWEHRKALEKYLEKSGRNIGVEKFAFLTRADQQLSREGVQGGGSSF